MTSKIYSKLNPFSQDETYKPKMATKTNIAIGKLYEFQDSKHCIGEYLGKIVVQYGDRINCKCHLSQSMDVYQFTNGNFTESVFEMGLVLKNESVSHS